MRKMLSFKFKSRTKQILIDDNCISIKVVYDDYIVNSKSPDP